MNYFSKIFKGHLIAFIIFSLFTVIITMLVKFTAIPESYSNIYMLVALSISAIFLGIYIGNLIGKHGLLYALGFSVLYTFLVIFAVHSAYSQAITLQSFDFEYIIPVILGGIGGIIGVNLRK